MEFLSLAALCAVVFVAAWFITWVMRRVAIWRGAQVREPQDTIPFIDRPNHRSSHSVPTPRGGGVGIVAGFIVAALVLVRTGLLAPTTAVAIVGGTLVAAVLGFIDDCGFVVSAKGRLLLHFVAAGWFLAWVGGVPPFPAFGVMLDWGWFAHILAAVYLVWLLNLFNFMDGIDGIAGIEAVTVALGGAFVWWMAVGGGGWMLPVAFAAAAAGFLVWNHPPAKIFMGDCGSCFIGVGLGAFSILAGWEAPHLFWAWAILMGCFIVDATVTLLRRLRRGHRFDEAHRSHAYQYASRKWRSHKRVAYAYGTVNVLWLLPVALLVALRRIDGAQGLLVAYAPLVAAAYLFKAGAPEQQEEPAEVTESQLQVGTDNA